MNKEKLKRLRSILSEIEEQKETQYTIAAWSLYHDDNFVMERNERFLYSIAKQIEEIPDCLVRRAIKLRYVNGKSWAEVSFKMGYTSPDGARKLIDRYLKKTSV